MEDPLEWQATFRGHASTSSSPGGARANHPNRNMGRSHDGTTNAPRNSIASSAGGQAKRGTAEVPASRAAEQR